MSDSCDPVDCSSPRSSVLGILQARTLEWVAVSSNRLVKHYFRVSVSVFPGVCEGVPGCLEGISGCLWGCLLGCFREREALELVGGVMLTVLCMRMGPPSQPIENLNRAERLPPPWQQGMTSGWWGGAPWPGYGSSTARHRAPPCWIGGCHRGASIPSWLLQMGMFFAAGCPTFF